jgi:hypothetical protein
LQEETECTNKRTEPDGKSMLSIQSKYQNDFFTISMVFISQHGVGLNATHLVFKLLSSFTFWHMFDNLSYSIFFYKNHIFLL